MPPDLAAAVMVQRPGSERPREDALLQAERSHHDLLVEDRDRLRELLEDTQEQLRELYAEIGLVSRKVDHPQYSRTQKAELALRFFEADLEWCRQWDSWSDYADHDPEGLEPPPRPDMRELVERWRADIAAGSL